MENNEFSYTYSAKEQVEIKKIRNKYLPKEVDKMEQLRRLDASVTEKATVVSLIVGILSALILGVGMCCCLEWEEYLIGIILGILGIGGVTSAYPLYNRIVKALREKIAPEIIRLTDELMK